MNELTRSMVGLATLLLVLALTVVNTCQIDNIERQTLDNAKMLETITEEGVMAHGAVAGGGGSAGRDSSYVGFVSMTAEEEALLNDPKNILRKLERPFADHEGKVRGGTHRMVTGSDPPGLNYLASNNAAGLSGLHYWFGNRIAKRDPRDPDRYVPDLAVAVFENKPGRDYTVHLKRGVYWHEPAVDWNSGQYDWLEGDHPLTAADFAFTFEAIQNPQVSGRAAAMRNYLEALDEVIVIDDHTLRITFSEALYVNKANVLDLWPSPEFIYMYDQDGNRLDESTWGLKLNEHWYNQKAIGTGPYRFVSWEPGVRIVLERNERYHGQPQSFDTIHYNIVKDQVAWPRKLKVGELDAATLQPEQYRTEIVEGGKPYLGRDGINFTKYDETAYFYIGWNADTKFFGDRNVRLAMTHALNRPGIIASVFHGLGDIHTGPFAKQQPCYDKSIEPYAFDLEKARTLLDEAGWTDTDGDGIRDKVIDGEKVPFEWTFLIYGSSNEYQTLANIYREDLLSIGVKMIPSAVEWSTMLKKMNDREFDAFSGAWVLGWDIDLMQLWHSSEADKPQSSNRIGFRNPEADRIAEALRREFDEEKRLELCRDFHHLLHEEQPYTFIYQRKRPFVYWDYLAPTFGKIYPYHDVRLFAFTEERP